MNSSACWQSASLRPNVRCPHNLITASAVPTKGRATSAASKGQSSPAPPGTVRDALPAQTARIQQEIGAQADRQSMRAHAADVLMVQPIPCLFLAVCTATAEIAIEQWCERAGSHADASSSGSRSADWLACAALEAMVTEDSRWYPWRFGSRIHYRQALAFCPCRTSGRCVAAACQCRVAPSALPCAQATRGAGASPGAGAWVRRGLLPVLQAHGTPGGRAPGVGARPHGAGPLLAVGAGPGRCACAPMLTFCSQCCFQCCCTVLLQWCHWHSKWRQTIVCQHPV